MTDEKETRLADSFVLAASHDAVWSFLVDVEAVAGCVPGMVAESVEIVEPDRVFTGTAQLKMGSTRLRFPATVAWIEQDPPRGGRLRARTQVAGVEVIGEGHILLEDEEGATRFSWSGAIEVPPQLRDNPLMTQMTSAFAARFMKAFFACLRERLEEV